MQVDRHDGAPSYDLADKFAAAMGNMAVHPGARIAAAVSGGADSMALACLLTQWSRANGVTLYALTVDHRLRDAAADEARQVARWMEALNVPHATLRWEEGADYRERPSSAQAAARDARYRLMTEWCGAHGCTHLFLAHHADDQAETFLLRLSRGSGVDGLGAMAPLTARGSLRLARPLLDIPKARLVAYLSEIGQPWIDDPSNRDESYGRVRFRAARQVLEREGLSTERLLATAGHMRRARAALDHHVQALLTQVCAWDRFGIGRIGLDALLAAPEDIGLRVLASLLMTASGQVYRPRFDSLQRHYAGLRTGQWLAATLHGCYLAREGAFLAVARESHQIDDEQPLHPGVKTIWDGRFDVEATGPEGAFHVRAFRVRRLLYKEVPAEARDAAGREVPLYARDTLPGIFDSAGLAAVPLLNYIRPDLTTSPGVAFETAFICPRNDQFSEDDAEL